MERWTMTSLEQKAFEIAKSAHWGQKDREGEDYILHPLRVSKRGKNENERIVGLLHDVVEDTDVTLEHLAGAGFPKEIINAIEALTKEEGEVYSDYLDRVKTNELAKAVKLYDIEDNSDPERLNKLDEETRERLNKKYRYAKDFLLSSLP